MNKIHLARGKRIDTGEWVTGYYSPAIFGSIKQHFIVLDYDDGSIAGKYRVDPATVGRCTGLKDKNGKLVYEGDICKDEQGGPFVIEFIDTPQFYGLAMKYLADGEILHLEEFSSAKDCVIGNIYDNPKLLEGSVE